MPTLPIVGAFFGMQNYGHPSLALEANLPVGAALILRAQPDNAYDPNAIQVLVPGASFPEACHEDLERALQGYSFTLNEILDEPEPWHLGFLPKDFAVELKSRGFPEGIDVPGTFSVNTQGKSRVRFEEG